MPRPRSRTLAAQMALLSLTVVSVTVVVATVLALGGVYRAVEASRLSRLSAYREIILEDISARLGMSHTIMDSVTSTLPRHVKDQVALSDELRNAALANVEAVDMMMAVDASGGVIAAYPGRSTPASMSGRRCFDAAAASADAVFAWERSGETSSGTLWVVRPFSNGSSHYFLVARLRTGFLQRVLDDVSSSEEHRTAVVYDGSGSVVANGKKGAPFDPVRCSLATDTSQPSGGSVVSFDGTLGQMRGYWSDLSPATGLDWRVFVTEPSSGALATSLDSLMPAGLAIIVAAALSVWAAAVFSERLVRPLRALAASADAVESGAMLKPVPVEREDEVGSVTAAFNAMAVRLNVLQELSQLLAASSRLDQVVEEIVSATERLLGTGGCAVFLVDSNRSRLDLSLARGLTAIAEDPSSRLDQDSWMARAVRTRRPLWFAGGREPGGQGEMARLFGSDRARSGLAVPLVAGREIVGLIVVLSSSERWFSEAELDMMRAFGAQAAMAIENSRTFEEERSTRREAEALRDVAETLEGTADFPAALHHVADMAAGLLGLSRGGLLMLDSSGLGIAEGSLEQDAGQTEIWRTILERDSRPGREHDPVVIENAMADPATAEYAATRAITSLMLVPLLQAGRRRGALVLECAEATHGFSDKQVALAATIGREVGLAMDNAFLLEKARSRAANLEVIFRISQAVSSSLQSTVVLNRVLDVVQKIFSAEAVSLMTYDAMKRTIVTAMARGLTNREMLYFEVHPGQDMPGEVFASHEARVFGPLDEVGTPLATLAAASGFSSMLAVPLLARGHSTGVLSVYSRATDTFATEEVELLLTFAAQAALAIDTAKLYGREHRVASVLQESILPDKLPVIRGLESDAVYRPSSSEAEIGGDYYDLFTAPDGRVVFAIADVAGKGIFAATKTQMIKFTLRGLVAAGLGPGEAAGELNRMVEESGDSADIVTIWLGYLDLESGELVYADGGHPPALVLDPERGSVRRLGPTGPVLGGVRGARYGEGTLSLGPGSTVMLYTDGVTEARKGAKFFGEGRVRRALRGQGTAAEVARRLSASVDRFAKGGLRDDAAILVVRVLGNRMTTEAV